MNDKIKGKLHNPSAESAKVIESEWITHKAKHKQVTDRIHQVTPKITKTITDLLGESYINKEVSESMLASLLLCFFFLLLLLLFFSSFYALGTLVKSI